jgi:hypothetical protein
MNASALSESARWWRKVQQQKTTTAASKSNGGGAAGLVNTLRHSPEGVAFVHERVAYYKTKVRSNTSLGRFISGERFPLQGASDLAMLAEFLEIQGSFQEALRHWNRIPTAVAEPSWLASRYRVEKQVNTAEAWQQDTIKGAAFTSRSVPVEDPASLSISRFYRDYAIPGVPVVIKGS